jgi:hypothetical protein
MTIYAHNNLFIQNKYYTWYYQIIDNARTKNYDGYSEVHHIVPRSLGGTDDPDNLVRLSFREHFIFHWLLIKFVSDPKDKAKMAYALLRMTSINEALTGKKIIASWQFEVAKRAAKENTTGEKHPNYGKKIYNNGTKEIKISADKEVPNGFVLGRLPRSEETRNKLSDNMRGKKYYNNGTKEIMISDEKEIPEGFVRGRLLRSEESRSKMGVNVRGKKRYNNGTKEIMISDEKEIPEGFVRGRLPVSDETRKKLSGNTRDRKYYNNGIKETLIPADKEIPEGFVRGRLLR